MIFDVFSKKHTFIISNLTHYNYIKTKIKVNIRKKNYDEISAVFRFGTFKRN